MLIDKNNFNEGDMKRVLFGAIALLTCSYSFAIDEITVIDHAKQEACKSNVECEKYFVDAIGIVSMISRYHGECVVDNDSSKQCKDAEKIYKYIMTQYDKNN
ncbi:hypothetical protein M997_2345 [Proteus hauseri ATCC 700826]|uniref:Uncharacterized protein n=2 Tax=Proteus hauseri TaxID=183417 RepID=A0AAJ3HRL6_PROHU|nr:hypothetical protein M997_2345 [Proteus hauseri ATCC 700826]